MEALQYQLLGFGRQKSSLADLVHPRTSPIIAAQSKLFRLAKYFVVGEASSWLLLQKVGKELESAEVKAYARKHLLQLSAGIDQIFELRFSHGVYRLGWMIFDDIPNEKVVGMLTSFFESPVECLFFAASQMVRLYPTMAAMSVHGPAVLKALFEVTPTSIGFSERSHNQLRQDVTSHGPASSFAAASERLLCREFAA